MPTVNAQLLLAPAAGGKTAHVVDVLRALPPLSGARVLLPDEVQVRAFRRRLARAGGALGVTLQTFYGLYADVLALAAARPGPPPLGTARLPGAVRRRLIRRLVLQACDAGQLSYYAPLRGAPGFAGLLAGLFEELKRARVLSPDLQAAVDGREPRLAELAQLYAAYQAWLLETGWMDAEGQGWLAALALEQDPKLLAGLPLLAVDGFNEFNPTQLQLLRLLAARSATTLVTLSADPARPNRLAQRRMARARAAVERAFDGSVPLSVTALPVHTARIAPALAHLETHLFEPAAPACRAEGAVQPIEAQNRAAEAREALRRLKACAVREGVPLSEMAVVARDLAPYRPFLEQVAAEFGLPLRFVSGAPLRANPAVAALLDLLALPLGPDGWSPRALVDALASPYFDWSGCGLQPGDGSRFEAVARAGQVIAGLDQWHAALEALSRRAPVGGNDGEDDKDQDEGEDEDANSLAPRSVPSPAEAALLAAAFEALVVQLTPPPAACLADLVAWVEERIGSDPGGPQAQGEMTEGPDDFTGGASLRVAALAHAHPATAARDAAALQALRALLRGMVLAEAVLGQTPQEPGGELPYGRFVAELTEAAAEATYDVPCEQDAILVASVLEVRGLQFDVLALLGLAEGDFPAPEREDPLLRETDRAWLAGQGFAVEPRLQGDEATLLYHAVTRARRRLLLTRPYLSADGHPWEPSPYWPAVLRLFEDLSSPEHVRPTDPIRDPCSAVEHARAASPPALRTRPPAGDLEALAPDLEARFGPGRLWSSSRLETYAKCPFYFWAGYVMELELQEPPRPGYDVLILGSLYHLVLERLYRQVPDGDPVRLRAELPAVADRVFAEAPAAYGFRPTPLWERQQEELTGVLRRTLEGLIEAAGEYRPLHQELAFGLQGAPPLVVGDPALPGGALQLRGYIDRVDCAPDGRLRIVDYKAGASPIYARDLDEGKRLQLPLYALAAAQALGAPVAGGFYWHVSAARASSLKLEQYQGGVPNAVQTAVEHALAVYTAVRAGQFAPQPPAGGCPGFCPAIVFCEDYAARAW